MFYYFRAIFTSLRIFILMENTVFIPGSVAPITVAQITTSMTSFTFSLQYTCIDITQIVVYREEHLVQITLTQAILEADIIAVQDQFVLLLAGRVG